jgi:hypothetical protein
MLRMFVSKWFVPMGMVTLFTLGLAAETEDEQWAFKLTPSIYNNSNQASASDVNLRGNLGSHVAWIGHYQQRSSADNPEFAQTRAGYEYSIQMPFGQLTPSVQAASKGFYGGSLTAQIGGQDLYGILGFGRTNLKPYYNLNFDPNDAITLGMGMRLPDKALLSFFVVHDDRLSTGQNVTHVVWRRNINDYQRITFDTAYKQGREEAESDVVKGRMVSLGFDHRQFLIKIARDQKVNFSNTDQTRASVGMRF